MTNEPGIFIKHDTVRDAHCSNVGRASEFLSNVSALIDAGHVVAVGENSIERVFYNSKVFGEWFRSMKLKRMPMEATQSHAQRILDEVIWESDNLDVYKDMAADVKSATRSDGNMVIIFEGRDSNHSKRYSGKISLRLVHEVQTIVGEYFSTFTKGSAPFTLTGRFIDQDMSSFEGRWIESPGYCAKFTF